MERRNLLVQTSGNEGLADMLEMGSKGLSTPSEEERAQDGGDAAEVAAS